MDHEDGLLSDETLGPFTSFDTTSGSETSCFQTSFNPVDSSKNISDVALKGSENLFGLQKNNYSSFGNSNNSGFSPLHSIEKSEIFSLVNKKMPSNFKIKDFKQLILETNDAYIVWMISEFLLGCYRESAESVSHLRPKVKEIMTASTVKEFAQVRSKCGKTFNILGLDDHSINNVMSKSMSSVEVQELNRHVTEVLGNNIALLSSGRSTLTGQFGSHCQRVMLADSVLWEDHERVAQLHHSIQGHVQQACQLLVSNNQMMQQLVLMQQSYKRDLKTVAITSLVDKAKYVHTVTSNLNIKLDCYQHRDKKTTTAMSALGNNLKTTLDSTCEQLKSLQKKLSEYENKEESSKMFKDIVAEYAKTKRQLHHKRQTLNILNDPDISFT